MRLKNQFEAPYWKKYYSSPDEMDCVGNALEHANYLKAVFDLHQITCKSVIDYGHGKGSLLEKIVSRLKLKHATGLDVSQYAYQAFKERLVEIKDSRIELFNLSISGWFEAHGEQHYDLGLCNSVFQYLSDEEVGSALSRMAKQVRYLYLTVPTDLELESQVEDLDFFDEQAIRRSQEFYLKEISKYFVVVSSRLLESRDYFSQKSSPFTDYLFRF